MTLKPWRQDDKIEQHKEWLEAIQTHGVNLTPWEDDFVESVDLRLRAGSGLTERQAEILERIYAEKTS